MPARSGLSLAFILRARWSYLVQSRRYAEGGAINGAEILSESCDGESQKDSEQHGIVSGESYGSFTRSARGFLAAKLPRQVPKRVLSKGKFGDLYATVFTLKTAPEMLSHSGGVSW